jgi:hypothetical protein
MYLNMLVKNFSFIELSKMLIGKQVNFVSDCELFDNFNVTGKVIKLTIAKNNEIMIHIITNSKEYQIGGNMSNLSFTIISHSI